MDNAQWAMDNGQINQLNEKQASSNCNSLMSYSLKLCKKLLGSNVSLPFNLKGDR